MLIVLQESEIIEPLLLIIQLELSTGPHSIIFIVNSQGSKNFIFICSHFFSQIW
jgi:hypothetical protein